MARLRSRLRASKRSYKMAIGAGFLIAIYYALYKTVGIALPCPWHMLTGWHCPGCGMTRLVASLITGDFVQAFRYNPLLFSLMLPGSYLGLDSLWAKRHGRKNLISKIPTSVWVLLIIIILAYGVLRNLPCGEFLAPTKLT